MPHLPTDDITRLAETFLRHQGLSLWGLEYLPSGKRSVLRVYADLAGHAESSGQDNGVNGVLLDELAKVSRNLSVALDAEDLIPGSYVLEVSSPGLDRKFFSFEQLAEYVTHDIEAALHDPCLDPEFSGRKRFKGRLVALAGDTLTLEVDNREVDLAWPEIKSARLAPKFEDPEKALAPKKRGKKKK